MLRPTSTTVKLLARAATMTPARKKAKLTKTIGLRPKMCENEPMTGWKTVEVSRKLVPAQKASIADPCSARAMI